MADQLFELDGVVLSRAGRVVLDHVSARLPEGASCVVGPSGSGKSTLLRLLNRLADPDRGRVRYRGRDVTSYDVLQLRREVCLVPQLPALLEGSVSDNVCYGPELTGRGTDVDRALSLSGLSPDYAQRQANKLSVGEQQRVMLARALALEPAVLLLDEPTSSLDAGATEAIERTLRHLRSDPGLSYVLVTHDSGQAARMSAWALQLSIEGRVLDKGRLGELLAN